MPLTRREIAQRLRALAEEVYVGPRSEEQRQLDRADPVAYQARQDRIDELHRVWETLHDLADRLEADDEP